MHKTYICNTCRQRPGDVAVRDQKQDVTTVPQAGLEWTFGMSAKARFEPLRPATDPEPGQAPGLLRVAVTANSCRSHKEPVMAKLDGARVLVIGGASGVGFAVAAAAEQSRRRPRPTST